MKLKAERTNKEQIKKIKEEQLFFMLGSSILIEALKGDKAKTEKLLHQGGPVVRRRVLAAIDRLRNWIEGH